MDISHRKCACLMVVMMLLSAYASSSSAELLVRSSNTNRKLLQWYGRGRGYGRGYNTGDAQFARNSAAIVNSQYAIRNAVESGASLPATAGAAYYAQDQAWQAANGWYPSGRWGWWGRR